MEDWENKLVGVCGFIFCNGLSYPKNWILKHKGEPWEKKQKEKYRKN